MDINYIAGFFDGEGTVGIYGKGTKLRARISISQTDENVLTLIKLHFGYGNVYKVGRTKDNWKDAWVYAIQDTNDVVDFLTKITPFLIVKKDIALDVLFKALERGSEINNRRNIRIDNKLKAIELNKDGLSLRKIAYILGVSRMAISRMLEEYKNGV